METKFKIKNFRAFDDNGVTVELSPLTFLVGCNSSGKSSIVKASILLNEFLSSLRDLTPGKVPRLEFNKKPLSLLGNFDSILNRASAQNGNAEITLSYVLDTPYLGRDVEVELSFVSVEKDTRKEGFLKRVIVTDREGAVQFHGEGFAVLDWIFPELRQVGNRIYGQKSNCVLSSSSTMRKRFFVYSCVCQILDPLRYLYEVEIHRSNVSEDDINKGKEKAAILLKGLIDELGTDIVLEAVDFFSNAKGIEEYRELFKVDRSIVEVAMKADILTYLPILHDLDSIEKKEFRNRFLKLCRLKDEGDIPRARILIDRVISDFENSDYELFSDFYRDLENHFLETMSNLKFEDYYSLLEFENYLDGIESSYTSDPVSLSFLLDDLEVESHTVGVNIPPKASNEWKVGELTLSKVFYLLTCIKERPNDDDYVRNWDDNISSQPYRVHRLLNDFERFRRESLRDMLLSDVCNNLQYISSNRIEVRRLYSFENQDTFGCTVSEYFEAMRKGPAFRGHNPGEFIDNWIRKFNIGHHFRIEAVDNGVGMVLKIYRDENDNDGRILADYGYGVSQLISILLEIETSIMKVKQFTRNDAVDFEKKNVNILKAASWGDITEKIPVTIAIEEPEIHLHPRYQSLLAELFYDAYKQYGIQFIVETHSEYLLRRIQTLIGAEKLAPNDVSMIYVEDDSVVQDGAPKARRINVLPDGRLAEPFSPGFYDAAVSLSRELLKMKIGQK